MGDELSSVLLIIILDILLHNINSRSFLKSIKYIISQTTTIKVHYIFFSFNSDPLKEPKKLIVLIIQFVQYSYKVHGNKLISSRMLTINQADKYN